LQTLHRQGPVWDKGQLLFRTAGLTRKSFVKQKRYNGMEWGCPTRAGQHQKMIERNNRREWDVQLEIRRGAEIWGG